MASPETQPEWVKDVVMFTAFVLTMLGIQYKASKNHREKIEALEVDIKEAKKAAAEANAKLSQCRLEVEQDFAPKAYLKDAEARIMTAFSEMKNEFRSLRDKMK